MTEQSIIRLLRSGNFTISYHDSDDARLYKGKWKYDDLVNDDGDEVAEEVYFDDESNGYTPAIVTLLVKALKGKVNSI